jgi:DNA repair exonuclease SbcCD ATPase subunit
MGSYKLLKLTLNNYRSFPSSEVVFQDSGMTLIRGHNVDTGGSSGSGKSSITGAIALAFGASPYPIKDQKAWGSSSGISVVLEFQTDEGVWVLRRGDKSTLKPPAGPTVTGSEGVDSRLRQVLGIDSEMLMALTYRRQHDRGLFLGKTDSEKKEFLTKVLGLEVIEKACELAATNVKAEETKVSGMVFANQQLETQLRGLPELSFEPELADLTPFRDLISKHTKRLALLDKQAKDSQALISVSELSLAETQQTINTKYAPMIASAQGEIAKIKADGVITANSSILPLPPELEKSRLDLASITDRLLKLNIREKERAASIAQEIRELDKTISSLKAEVNSIPRLEKELVVKKAQISSLQGQNCPTCQQQWVTDNAKKQLNAFLQEKSALESTLSAIRYSQEQLPTYEEKRKGLVFEPDPKVARFQEIITSLTGELRGLEATAKSEQARQDEAVRVKNNEAKAAFQQKVTNAQLILAGIQADSVTELGETTALNSAILQNTRKELQEIQGNIYAARSEKAEAEMGLRLAESENAARTKDFETRLASRAKAQSQLLDSTRRLDEARATLASEQDFEDFVGYKGFLGSIFDEVLAEVTEETNNILGSVANTSHVTLHFVSEVLPQKGGTPKREIKPMISIGGNVATLKSGASGGMQTSINLAVDLAVAKVVSRRTASYPGWMILDESFDGLDSVSKETCLGMLAKYAEDRLVLIVDHSSETKEMFSNFLDVEYCNGVSSIKKS